ncbi:MAG TPA: sigma-70 family RNA polymerase sigma factor [Candidatus Polarisedimenticolia bacterium]|nr:sigma-70 family RNA polymerase sigma factor [Candidatus Polarisedimenticolia bacterium]
MPSTVTPPDDRALIDQAQRGDRSAFEELVRRYDRQVLRLALSLVRSADEAREIYQEAFLKMYRSLGSFRQQSGFGTWAYRIVTNLCLDRLRRAAARPEESAPGPGSGPAGATPGGRLERIPDGRAEVDPERALAAREIRERIASALRRLSPRERLVFELRHHHGLRLRAIGEILETSEETARNCLFRAHRDLRAALGDIMGERAPRRAGA